MRFFGASVAFLAGIWLSPSAFAQTPLPQQLFDPPVYPSGALAFDRTTPPRPVPSGTLVLSEAIRRALAANPRLTAAERDIGIAAGRRIQASAYPNPELSFELDDALGSGLYRGLNAAETTLQLSQSSNSQASARHASRLAPRRSKAPIGNGLR